MPTDLSQCALQFSQEIGVLHTAGIAVNVIDLETQLLHHLKVVVDDKGLGKLGVETVHDFFRPPNLTDARGKVRTCCTSNTETTIFERSCYFDSPTSTQ